MLDFKLNVEFLEHPFRDESRRIWKVDNPYCINFEFDKRLLEMVKADEVDRKVAKTRLRFENHQTWFRFSQVNIK